MVKIVDFAQKQNKEGKNFFVLLLQSGLEMVKSEETGRYYATMRKCTISSTFDEATCKSLIGQQMSGTIAKVECEPYAWTNKETGEVLTLNYRFAYRKEGETLEEKIFEGKVLEPEF